MPHIPHTYIKNRLPAHPSALTDTHVHTYTRTHTYIQIHTRTSKESVEVSTERSGGETSRLSQHFSHNFSCRVAVCLFAAMIRTVVFASAIWHPALCTESQLYLQRRSKDVTCKFPGRFKLVQGGRSLFLFPLFLLRRVLLMLCFRREVLSKDFCTHARTQWVRQPRLLQFRICRGELHGICVVFSWCL